MRKEKERNQTYKSLEVENGMLLVRGRKNARTNPLDQITIDGLIDSTFRRFRRFRTFRTFHPCSTSLPARDR